MPQGTGRFLCSAEEFSLLPTSLIVLFTLIAMFAASCAMFYLLVHRWTSRRQSVALSEWGKDAGFRLRACPPGKPPAPLDAAAGAPPAVRVCMAGKRMTLVQARTAAGTSQSASDGDAPNSTHWNLLVREIERPWPPTGLRPTGAGAGIVDLFSLSGFPLLGNSERFVVYGSDAVAAAGLARSAARGLLPADVGLLLHGTNLVLDFSSRPFDAIEFERMIAVANQIVSHLPTSDAPG